MAIAAQLASAVNDVLTAGAPLKVRDPVVGLVSVPVIDVIAALASRDEGLGDQPVHEVVPPVDDELQIAARVGLRRSLTGRSVALSRPELSQAAEESDPAIV